MKRLLYFLLISMVTACSHTPKQVEKHKPERPAWMTASDRISKEFTVSLGEFYPETASSLGFSEFETKGRLILPHSDERDKRFFSEWLIRINQELLQNNNIEFRTDLEIFKNFLMRRKAEIELDQELGVISFTEATKMVYSGLQELVNDQSSAQSKKAAASRFKMYVNGGTNSKSLTVALREYYFEQLEEYRKLKKLYPFQKEVAEYLEKSSSFLAGIKELLEASGDKSWQADYALFEQQVKDYDSFLKTEILPKSRKDYKLPKKLYIHALKDVGIEDTTPEQLISLGRKGYNELYKDYQALAIKIADNFQLEKKDPVSVMRFLKSMPLTDKLAIEELYKETDNRLKEIIIKNNLITLPRIPLKIRFAGEAESKAQPVPHLRVPPMVNNKGQRPEFVVPTTAETPFDDFSTKASALGLVAHEGRPGHDMQFSQILDMGSTLIRGRYAFNSVNIEGWGLYAEDLVFPYATDEEKLFLLQMRLWRMARMFLDPQIQLGQIKEARVIDLYVNELGVSEAMAQLELRRYTYENPAQAPSYYFGYLQVKQMRKDAELRLGQNFNMKCFNDKVLSYGVLPLKLVAERLKTELVCN